MATDWVLVPCLQQLNAELWEISPNRDMASSGTIGDQAHADRVSDHNPDETGAVPIHDADKINEVHALDVDSDLRTPGLSMAEIVAFIVGRCRSGAENRLRYVIYARTIYEATRGWKARAYTGADPHINHAHFSASYDTAREASRASWHMKELTMATQFSGSTAATDVAQLDASAASITTQTAWSSGGGQHSKAGDGVWNTGIPRKPGAADATTNPRDYAWTLIRDILIASQSAVVKLDQLSTAVATLQADNTLMKQQLDQLTADAADTPNLIVEDVRYAIANP
jgi:hypothetical protein